MAKIAVFGIGGVGGYFGGQLARLDDHEVYFIARGKQLKAIQNDGLHLQTDKGDYTVRPALASNDAAVIGPVDYVIVATKAWQVEDAAEKMRPLISDGTTVVPLLNGVEAPAKLGAILGEDRVLGGYCRVMSRITRPGHVKQGGVEPYVAFGELDKTMTDRVRDLENIFKAAGVTVEASDDIEAAMWQKLVFIAPFSGVGAVTRAPAGVILNVPETYQMLKDAMIEVVRVAQARGINLTDFSYERGLNYFGSLRPTATASMQRDIMQGRPSELDAQNGAIVRLGEEVGVETPVNRFIYNSLLPNEKTARGEISQ